MDEFVREFLVESYENLDQLDQDLVALEGKPGSRDLLSRVFRTIHTIKGTCGFLAFGRLESLTHAGEGLLSELRDGQRAMNQPTTDALLSMVDTIREILASIEAFGGEGQIAVDGVIEQIRGVLEDSGTEAAPDVAIPAPSPRPPPEERAPVTVSESAIRVGVDVLDSLMRQVGELVLVRNQITRLFGGQLDADLVRASQRLSQIASELQDGVKKARMQPIGRLWAQMPRVVRDLEAVCGRQVHLEVVGGDIELDRALLEAVKDPLMHLVRNAVDHGIEDVETRVAAGKRAEGALVIRAYYAGGRVVVEVEDDGKGIDADQVASVAVARGHRTAEEVAAMATSDLLQLLFLPGFSLAEEITNVSGRGVGLDVVHTNIGAIGGTVEVESATGRGTTWRLRIPLTLAIISALIVESAGQLYAIPTVNVLEFVAPDMESGGARIEYVGCAPVLRLRGTLLPLVGLPDVLGLPGGIRSGQPGHPGHQGHPDHGRQPQGPTVVAVLQADNRRFGLILTRVLDTEEIVVMPLQVRLRGLGIYTGATLLGDGRVSLILDVQGIARQSLTGQSIEVHRESRAAPALPVASTGQVLVVGVGGGQRVAIPLAVVTRLERVRADAVEHVGRREVLQYRRTVVPLVRLDHLIGEAVDPVARDLRHQELLVVLFTRGVRTVAVVVDEVLDIVDDDAARHSEIDDRGLVASTVVGDRVTELLNVRQVVLSADPSFFDDDADYADDADNSVGLSSNRTLGAVGA